MPDAQLIERCDFIKLISNQMYGALDWCILLCGTHIFPRWFRYTCKQHCSPSVISATWPITCLPWLWSSKVFAPFFHFASFYNTYNISHRNTLTLNGWKRSNPLPANESIGLGLVVGLRLEHFWNLKRSILSVCRSVHGFSWNISVGAQGVGRSYSTFSWSSSKCA